MTIEKIHIDSFGGLSDVEVALTEGVNIVEGRNEAGKSTVAAFIAWVLYGFDKNDRRRYIPLDGSPCSGHITVKDDEKLYTISRGGESEASITDCATLRLVHTGELPGQLFIGVPRDIFVRTAYISQADGAYINGADIRDSMENLLYSADETVSVTRAQKKLDELRVSLLHKNGRGGRLYNYRIERDKLTARLQRASEDNGRVIELEGSLRQAKETLTARGEELEGCRRSIEFYDTVSMLSAADNIRSFDEREAKAVADYNALISANTYDGYVPDSEYTENVKAQSGEAQRLNDEIAALDAEIKQASKSESDQSDIARQLNIIKERGGRKILASRFKALKTRSSAFGITAAICFIFAAIGAAAAIYMNKTGSASLSLIFAAVSVVCAIAAFAALFIRVKPRKAYTEILDSIGVSDARALYSLLDGAEEDEIAFRVSEEKLISLRDRRDACAERAAEKQTELKRLLALWNASSAEDAVTRATKFIGAIDECRRELEVVRKSREAVKSSLGDYDEDALRLRYTELKDTYLPIVNAGDFDISALRRKDAFFDRAQKAMSEKVSSLERELAALKAVTEQPAPISDAIYALDGKITADGERYKACVLAYSALTEASAELRSSVSPRISRQAGSLMEQTTGGKYNALGVDSELALTFNRDGKACDVSYMSAGTRDLAYISLRLALMKVLFTNPPPVIFDESFARLDDERLQAALKLLYEYSKANRQAVLFTCRDRDTAAMNKVGAFNSASISAIR